MKMLMPAIVAALCACASRSPRLNSSWEAVQARARGNARITRTVDRGTMIELRFARLPDPETLNPPGYTYVAWVQGGRESPPQNVGALILAKDLSGKLRTFTPLRHFTLFVTAEASGDASRPSGLPLFWTNREDWVMLSSRAGP